MGIQSMTGFGKSQRQNEDHALLIELKSVNHRFIDTRFRIPQEFNQLELSFKKKIGKFFKRGSFDIYVSYKNLKGISVGRLDKIKIKNFLIDIQEVSKELDIQMRVSAGDFFKPEFFQNQRIDQIEGLFSLIETAFEEALSNLHESRLAEGLRLSKVIGGHLKRFREIFLKIEPLEKNYQTLVESKLKTRFQELSADLQIDEKRFFQEVIYYLEKLDIKEEINRIRGHLCELEKVLDLNGEVGRKMDFILQELNRETNTLAAKSGLKEISENVLEMKMELEKIREQVANLE